MSETLDVLRKSHQALMDYEAARERKHGPRQPADQARVRAVIEAYRKAWLEAGGSEAEFLLAPLLSEGVAARPTPEDKPKRRER